MDQQIGMPALRVRLIHPSARPPTYGSEGAAALDFYAPEGGFAAPGAPVKVGLGLAIELPPRWALLITARSGHGLRFGAGVPHGYGLIDPDYRGELAMVFTVTSPMVWQAGDRIAQGKLSFSPQFPVEIVDELSPSARGAGGFGSTGA